MPRSATATGNIYDTPIKNDTERKHNMHWRSDPTQLSHWQAQLVDCCDAINLQLSQIQNELTSRDGVAPAPASLRLVGEREIV